MTTAPDPAEVRAREAIAAIYDQHGEPYSAKRIRDGQWPTVRLDYAVEALASATEAPPVAGMGEDFEALIEAEAAQIAERENACSGCCGPYGDDTADDYRDDVRRHFEEIGRAYVAALTKPTPPASVSGEVVAGDQDA